MLLQLIAVELLKLTPYMSHNAPDYVDWKLSITLGIFFSIFLLQDDHVGMQFSL